MPPFLDSNVLIYAFAADARAAQAQMLLGMEFVTGVQALNEFSNVARRKLGMGWAEVAAAAYGIAEAAITVFPTLLDDHKLSLQLVGRYNLSVFDSLLLAIAYWNGCTRFLSEDMHGSLVIENRLRIVNPFREGFSG